MQGTSADPFRMMSGCSNLNSDIKEGRSGIAEYARMMDGARCAWLTCRRGRAEPGKSVRGQRGHAKTLPRREGMVGELCLGTGERR